MLKERADITYTVLCSLGVSVKLPCGPMSESGNLECVFLWLINEKTIFGTGFFSFLFLPYYMLP